MRDYQSGDKSWAYTHLDCFVGAAKFRTASRSERVRHLTLEASISGGGTTPSLRLRVLNVAEIDPVSTRTRCV